MNIAWSILESTIFGLFWERASSTLRFSVFRESRSAQTTTTTSPPKRRSELNAVHIRHLNFYKSCSRNWTKFQQPLRKKWCAKTSQRIGHKYSISHHKEMARFLLHCILKVPLTLRWCFFPPTTDWLFFVHFSKKSKLNVLDLLSLIIIIQTVILPLNGKNYLELCHSFETVQDFTINFNWISEWNESLD